MKARLWGFALLVASLDANAAPASDPWALAPVLPTACYVEQDNFSQGAYAQVERIQAALNRQRDINQGIQDRLNALDPMEKQRRMTEYMMSNPDEAQDVLAAMQSQGQAHTQSGLAAADEEIRQKQALDALVARYDAALDAATRPHYDKIKALPLCDGECRSPQWAIDQAIVEYKLIEQKYVKLCGQWWAKGLFPVWFSGYRKFLAGQIPQQEEAAATARATNAMVGITGDYRSEAPLRAVELYTQLAARIFDKRWAKPRDLSEGLFD